jgi:hypothetical protein
MTEGLSLGPLSCVGMVCLCLALRQGTLLTAYQTKAVDTTLRLSISFPAFDDVGNVGCAPLACSHSASFLRCAWSDQILSPI